VTSVRSLLRAVGAPSRALLIGLVRGYRATLSGWLGGQCRFYPSCSVYAEQAIRSRGALVGSALAVWRVLRCNPFGRGGVEHVRGHRASDYDAITRPPRDAAA
jgi:putative membrane protein insertion efficiency factor